MVWVFLLGVLFGGALAALLSNWPAIWTALAAMAVRLIDKIARRGPRDE
jgi:hypothetical protein